MQQFLERISKYTEHHRFNYILLIVVGSLLFIPFIGTVHLFDWDEVNFAEAAREMLLTKKYTRVTIDYQPFWEKPPFFFWLQLLSMKMFGVGEFAARFVNAIFGILTLLVVYTVGAIVYDKKLGLLWALAFMGSFLPHIFFKSGIMDPVFNLFIFLGISLIASAILSSDPRKQTKRYLIAGIVTGIAVLTKGPVAFLIVALTMGVYWAFLRFKMFFRIRHVVIFLLAMASVSFVFYGIETLLHGTWFIREFTLYQIRLLRTGDAGHGRPFYFHFVVILFGCFPASFFAIRSFFRRDESGSAQQLYNRLMVILFWVVLILFSLVKTKTVLYSSMTYFPLTYLAALHMRSILKGSIPWNKQLGWALALFSFVIALAITLFPIIIINKEWIVPFIKDNFAVATLQKPVSWSGMEFLIGIAYGGVLLGSFFLIMKKRFWSGFVGLYGSSALCLLLFLLVFAPKIESYTQGGPIAFYKENASKDVYVRALFKSYADLFYARKKPGAHPKSHDIEWLLSGPIDKPAYFVAKSIRAKKYDDPKYDLVKLKDEYGYVYYRRDPVKLITD